MKKSPKLPKQLSFASYEFAQKKRVTRREKFLAEMEQVVPWTRLEALIEPLYPTSGRVGRPPKGVRLMLRMYFLQQWFGLADEALEDAIYDSQSMREFTGIDLSREAVPDATTLLKFRRLLEEHGLTAKLFEGINADLAERGLLLREGTMVDATIIAAPPSTKNKEHARDPEMHQTKKGNEWRVSRTQAADLWCCTEDGSRPPEAGLQEQASNHPVLLRSKGAVVSDRAKVIPSGVAGTYGEDERKQTVRRRIVMPKALSKLRWTIGFRTNRDATCLRTRWQPVYRRHDLNTGFGTERENLSPDAKGNDKWPTP